MNTINYDKSKIYVTGEEYLEPITTVKVEFYVLVTFALLFFHISV